MNNRPAVYLDYNATAPLAPEAAEAISAWLKERAANPSSLHLAGQQARAAVEAARADVASFLAVDPAAVVFTSGGTEADNLALWGALGWPPTGHLVVSAIEHPAVLEPAAALKRLGVAVTRVGVDAEGIVDPREVERALRPNTRLVSVMAANNEVGSLQPVAEIAAIAHAAGALFHCDAVQAAPWMDLAPLTAVADLLSLSAHKLAGPVGIGCLTVRGGLDLQAFVRGGGTLVTFERGDELVIERFGVPVRNALDGVGQPDLVL
ncbi:MAG: cysteine desulfurase family protein, partial [Acidobacteriota bacterium]